MRYVNTHMMRMMYMPPYSVHTESPTAPGTMTWRCSREDIYCTSSPKLLSALDLIFADFPHRIKKIEIEALHTYLRQSLPAAGIIEESESARGERGRVGQGRVGFRV